jgi:hypothetical protein
MAVRDSDGNQYERKEGEYYIDLSGNKYLDGHRLVGQASSRQGIRGKGGSFVVFMGIFFVIAVVIAFIQDNRVYFISIAGVIAFFVVLFFVLRALKIKRFIQLMTIPAGLIALLITILCLGRYGKTRIDPAVFDTDVIVSLDDGSSPLLYNLPNSFSKQKTIETLTIGERVKILGATRDRQNYRIQTIEGNVGYVDKAALPEDGMPLRKSLLDTNDNDAAKRKLGKDPILLDVDSKTGQASKLTRIAYLEEYTIIGLKNVGSDTFQIDKPGAANAYYIQDLDTSETYPLAEYNFFYRQNEGVYLIFPPFKTRHFDLIEGQLGDNGRHFRDVKVPENP